MDENREADRLKARASDRKWRENHHDKHIHNCREWRKKNPGHTTRVNRLLSDTEEGRKKLAARKKAAKAIEAGKITRKPCDHCGAWPAEAHHEDYDSPLQVVWLCRLHHRRRHSVLGHTIRIVETV